MNERNDQNINGYGQPVIPQSPTEPVNNFNSNIQQNTQPSAIPVQPEVSFQQPVNEPNYANVVSSNSVSNVGPVNQAATPLENNQSFEQQSAIPVQPEVSFQQPINEPNYANVISPNSVSNVDTGNQVAENNFEQPVDQEGPKVVEQPNTQVTIQPVIQPKESVEKTVNEIMDKPVKKEKKSRHKKSVDDNWEEKPKKKGHGVLIIILVLIILGLGAYIVYDKGLVQLVMNKINGTEPKVEKKIEEKVEEEPVEETPVVIQEPTSYFISIDQKNSLMLGKEISGLKNFVLVLAQDQASQNVTGTYEIKDDKLTLTVKAGCLDANANFTCTLPDGAEALNNNGIVTITLNYTDEKILLGNIELIKENNQVNNEISSDTKNLTTE